VVGEVGGEILFRLCILNSVSILVLATEGKRPPCGNMCVSSIATRVLLGFNLLHGWACIVSFWVTEFENTMMVFPRVCFVCV
jgi:hypothetical protein